MINEWHNVSSLDVYELEKILHNLGLETKFVDGQLYTRKKKSEWVRLGLLDETMKIVLKTTGLELETRKEEAFGITYNIMYGRKQ